MKNKSIKICDTTIHPGEVANLALPLPEQHSCSPLYMPIKVIHSKIKGPCLLLISTLQGIELNGLDIVNRITKMITPDKIRGTIIAIPVVNIYGLMHYPSVLPIGNNLAECFPGDENGNFGERIAHILTQEIFTKADYCIELQTGGMNHNILPQVYCNFEQPKVRNLAKAFQSPVITQVEIKDNNLRKTMEELQIPLLVYQGGEAMRFDENVIVFGVDGIKNVMRSIDMLDKEPIKEVNPIFSRDEEWIVAHKGGILRTEVTLGQTVQKNELLGTITDPFGSEVLEPVIALQEAIVVGINTTPLIHEGLPLFKMASFLDYEKAESVIEAWDQQQPDSYIN
ncbi:MAG: succinylglutamate desuccinylase/aspartoacylase family protein [Gammaproteobacteria bacterium]|nr:succinylglutamate desuccinylase/aspartoacylase family protein [Gammaproteobacteria bacterium]